MGEIVFNSASGAYRWAVEAAERPGITSSTQVVMRGLQEQTGSGNLSKHDIADTALSILAACSKIQPIHACMAFKAALGPADEEMDAEISARLADDVSRARGLDYSKCSRLARIVLLRTRASEQHGQAIPRAWYAHALGIRRQSLSGWESVIQAMEQLMDDWVSQGKMKAKQLLDEKGLTRPRNEPA